jgi:hypothetical protein
MRSQSLFLVVVVLGLPASGRADVFDHYTNPVLIKMIGLDNVKEVKQLTPDTIAEHDGVLKGVPATFLVVQTQEGRYAKLLVVAARQKLDEDGSYLSTLRVERYVTYRGGEELATQATGQSLTLFPGYRLSLDLGQVVPEDVGGDLRFVVTGNRITLQPLGKAKLFVVVKPMPDVVPKKAGRPVVGEKFDPAYYNGAYKLYDDGRRSGKLTLKVDAEGTLSGFFYSDKDGSKYEVRGRVGMPQHTVQFTVKYPRSEQFFTGWLFTGDAAALSGSSRLADRETGFYAVRVDE